MQYSEALIELSKGAPEDALTDMIVNRIGGAGDCLTDRNVTHGQRAAIVDILKRAQREVAAVIQMSRRARGTNGQEA